MGDGRIQVNPALIIVVDFSTKASNKIDLTLFHKAVSASVNHPYKTYFKAFFLERALPILSMLFSARRYL